MGYGLDKRRILVQFPEGVRVQDLLLWTNKLPIQQNRGLSPQRYSGQGVKLATDPK
jgi:hypothetical protein